MMPTDLRYYTVKGVVPRGGGRCLTLVLEAFRSTRRKCGCAHDAQIAIVSGQLFVITATSHGMWQSFSRLCWQCPTNASMQERSHARQSL